MDKEIKELMQIKVIGENTDLSKLIEDIIPKIKNVNTIKDICCEKVKNSNVQTAKSQEFRIVVYKKSNPISRAFKEIKYIFKKIKILGKTKEIKLAQNKNMSN